MAFTSPCLGDRLVDELYHVTAITGTAWAGTLGHKYSHEIVFRVDSEIGAAIARSHELAFRTEDAGDAVLLAHRHPEA